MVGTDGRVHTTRSGVPVDAVYGPAPRTPDGLPGAFRSRRGPYASMYRGRLWTMRQFAGYGTPAETNERFRLLLERGQTGLSVAFDMPTLMGLDPDDPRRGKCITREHPADKTGNGVSHSGTRGGPRRIAGNY